jgi:CPA2 family monovalent cation:H+ antiporter-2
LRLAAFPQPFPSVHDLTLIYTLAAAFAAAWLCGLVTQRIGLSPIVGYLLAGVLIGPHTPGINGDVAVAQQLSEVGVILLMFGVGIHFHLKDLLAVRNVALPGAFGQVALATLLAIAVAGAFGWPLKSGLVLGLALSVASTVVLVRVLTDNRMMDTVHGHVAVGWLIVEDVLTVVVLILIPALASAPGNTLDFGDFTWLAVLALGKLLLMSAVMLWGGAKLLPWVMVQVTRLRSRELFTLTVLVMAITVAALTYLLFGASMALGAFLGGMLIGQSPLSKQAASDILPMRDAFAVLFFTAVGMLFDPAFLLREPLLVLACLAIVLVGKPLAALLLVALIGYPARTGLVVALGLAQVGEFTFIVSSLAQQHGLLDSRGHNVLVACAILSITVNPMLFRSIDRVEAWLRTIPWLWRLLNWRADQRVEGFNLRVEAAQAREGVRRAVILGYGSAGAAVDDTLRARGFETLVVDLDLSKVQEITRQGRLAIYGDAANPAVYREELEGASHLVLTLPDIGNRLQVAAAAKAANPSLKVFVRAAHARERQELEQLGVAGICFEEAEAAVSLGRLILESEGVNRDAIRRQTTRIRQIYHRDHPR